MSMFLLYPAQLPLHLIREFCFSDMESLSLEIQPFVLNHGLTVLLCLLIEMLFVIFTQVPKFVELVRIEDPQVIRTAAFHPDGQVFAVGSNSKVLCVCHYPSPTEIRKLLELVSSVSNTIYESIMVLLCIEVLTFAHKLMMHVEHGLKIS